MARGAVTGAPSARQTADRPHLTRKPCDVSEPWPARLQVRLPLAEPPVTVEAEPDYAL